MPTEPGGSSGPTNLPEPGMGEPQTDAVTDEDHEGEYVSPTDDRQEHGETGGAGSGEGPLDDVGPELGDSSPA